ncbi:hypothetical protein Ahu01nite_072110 [Winogradskya humida]|uniref:Metallo-beta-lactamase domain-containing protein n=2 Tax=Winogradskya humida TaxID=113566 RepID=A0ABQ3ZZV5_9ACTN|nr:hypothetical protein Ahu01nite_072110 [Actinoplanes humidus]
MTGFREIADRVYVMRYPVLDVNVTLVTSPGAALVVDTLSTAAQAGELADAIRGITRDPLTIVNTHHHFDHCFGNATLAGPGVPIWAHEDAARELRERAGSLPHDLYERWLPGDPELAAGLAEVTVRVPDRLVGARATVDVAGRAVALHHLGRGHTGGDLVVHVPDAGVTLAGDLVEQRVRARAARAARRAGTADPRGSRRRRRRPGRGGPLALRGRGVAGRGASWICLGLATGLCGHQGTMNPLRWPLWVRSLIAGLLWGGFMYVFVADGPRTVLQGVVFLVGGLAFGLAMWGLARSQERRLFGDLSEPERTAAVEAVRAARPPEDSRLGAAATRIATGWATPRMRPVHLILAFGFFLVLSVYVAITVTPWGWFGIVFWPLVAWLSIRTERRQQRVAERYLAQLE